jgi:hypothetical protein
MAQHGSTWVARRARTDNRRLRPYSLGLLQPMCWVAADAHRAAAAVLWGTDHLGSGRDAACCWPFEASR